MADFIQLKKDNVLRLGIKDANGKDTGEHLEFDLEDIELPLKYQTLIEEEKKNRKFLQNQFVIIDKRQDVKGKKLMSKNEEDKMKVLQEFYKKEAEIYNMFLGERGVEKLLNGRKLNWTFLEEVGEIIEEQIAPHLDMTMDKIKNKIKGIYDKDKNKEELK